MIKSIKPIYLIIATILALIPQYLIRFHEDVYMWLYVKFTTYPGDLWNFFANYLHKGLQYPPEYPAGMRFFYQLFNFQSYENYSQFFTVNAIILAIFALGTTYLLYRILIKSQKLVVNGYKIIIFWILAPSFLFYSLINYDLPVVFLIVLALYFFLSNRFYGAIVCLAIGTVIKFFPIFLLPIFILKSPKQKRWKMLVIFIIIVLALNLPYIIANFDSWLYTYTWQISDNLSKTAQNGTFWWIFYPVFGKFSGWVSLILFAILYFITYKKLHKSSIINLCLAVIILFLLTDRIYSPQYDLYLLPFLVLVDYKISKKWFYLLEIPNVMLVFFIFWLREHAIWLQFLVFCKYFALIMLYLNNYRASIKSIQISK